MKYELVGDVAIFRLDDGKANAVSHQLIDTLMSWLDQAEGEAKAVILLGKAGLFSAGFDLKEIAKGPSEAAALVNKGAHLMFRLYGYKLPLVAGCTGHAVAAGAFMLLAADTRIGTAGEFSLGLNETSIGMTLPVFGHELAAARLSKRHLTPAVIQSRMYGPNEAVDAGFLDEVVAADALETVCMAHAEKLAALPTETHGQMKRDVRASGLANIEASLKPV